MSLVIQEVMYKKRKKDETDAVSYYKPPPPSEMSSYAISAIALSFSFYCFFTGSFRSFIFFTHALTIIFSVLFCLNVTSFPAVLKK